jgi:sugar diacid utilization regulator
VAYAQRRASEYGFIADPRQAQRTLDDVEMSELAARASRDARGVPAELLDGYLTALADVSNGRRLSDDELRSRRDMGAHAAEQGVPMSGVIDLYLSATWIVWPSLPGVRAARGAESLCHIGEAVLRAADVLIMAVAEGYEEAQRWSLRQEESFRRAFVDDLLDGRLLGTLAGRAERYGLRLAAAHVVVAAAADTPFVDGDAVTRKVESGMHIGRDVRDVLVTARDGLLICVAPDACGVAEDFIGQVSNAMGAGRSWRAGVGRPHRGPGGAVRSFEQAKQALAIGRSLHLPGKVHSASDLLVYQVLMRDQAALADLVEVVLEPLRSARTGPLVLLETLSAYFAADRVATAAALDLHVGVRTVTYRLNRVKTLTGYSASDPRQSFTLQVAVLGARLLGWPDDRRKGLE